MRVAAIDIGTNTVLLLVAEADNAGLRPVLERATITRLGAGVDRARRLQPAAVERTIRCLEDYSGAIRAAGVDLTAVVGTSAMRDAHGGEIVREAVRALFGVEARVLDGDEGARLTYLGALGGLGAPQGEEVAVFDLGGGSTEVIVGTHTWLPTISWARSIDVGSVRMSERHGADLEAVTSAARQAFANVPPLGGSRPPIGVAGTMTTLASVSMKLDPYDGARVHGSILSLATLASLIAQLGALDLDARKKVPGMEPARADVIVAGGLVAMALLEHWGAEAVQISDRGVRWGLAQELARGGRDAGALDK